jgi:hypothetical protein
MARGIRCPRHNLSYRPVQENHDEQRDARGHGRRRPRGLTGAGFTDIRFIDRFALAEGRLFDQRVWNSLAEGRP